MDIRARTQKKTILSVLGRSGRLISDTLSGWLWLFIHDDHFTTSQARSHRFPAALKYDVVSCDLLGLRAPAMASVYAHRFLQHGTS